MLVFLYQGLYRHIKRLEKVITMYKSYKTNRIPMMYEVRLISTLWTRFRYLAIHIKQFFPVAK